MFALVCVVAAPVSASANWMMKMANRLNLTAAQQSSIKNIVYKQRRSQITLKANLQLARLDLRQLLDQHKPDETKVIAAVDKAGSYELQLKKSRILMMVRIKSVLTAKQAKQWSEFQRQRRARRRKWRKRRRRRWMKRRRRMMRRKQMQGGGQDAP